MSWRNGLVIGSSACGSLGEPYVLWDTRVWRAGAIGQGLRAMPNLGIGGSLWDLDVIVQDYFGLKLTIAGHNDFKRLSSPHIPWSTVGGVPCNGPITIMTAFGDFPSNDSSFAEADMLFSTHKYRSDLSLAQSLGSVENWANDIANANVTFVATWHETPPNNFGIRGTTYNQWNLPSAADFTPGSLTQFQRNTLVAVTLDSVKDKCHKCFVNNVVGGGAREIPEQENGPGDEFFVIRHPTPGGSGGAGDCTAHDGETHIGSHHFFYLGEDQRPAPGAQPGVPFGPVVGSALFRGTVSAGSMQYWHDYFYGPAPAPLPPYVSPFPYSGGFSKWTDGTYAYHEFSGVAGGGSFVPVVGRTLPSTIDFWVVGGGGGSAGFQAPAGGGGGGGGEVIQMLGVAAPGSSRTFVQGAGGVSRTNGGNSTFMGFTARGGRGATSSTGGMNGNLVTPGGTRLLAERAAGGGGGAGGPGGNVIDTAGGGLGGAAFQIVTIGGSTIPWAAGGHGGGNTGTIPIRISNLVEPGGQATRFSSPDAPPLRGGGGGGRISSSNTNGFPGAVGGLVIRYLLPT